MNRNFSTLILVLLATLSGLALASCGNKDSDSATANSTAQSSPVTPKVGFEADLEYVRKGQYTYVWVFSRKDGKPLDKDDGAFLRANAHQVVDWVTTEQGKKVIAGTNFDLTLGNLDLIRKRLVVEDYTAK